MNSLYILKEKLIKTLDSERHEWLEYARVQLIELNGDLEFTANKLVFLTASAKRKLGLTLLSGEIDSGFKPDIYDQSNKIHLDHWTVTDAARVLMLTETISSTVYSSDELFQLCYRFSDGGERASLLKGLALFNLRDQSIDFIVDIARTNSVEIFSALIFKNPWPVIKLPVLAFNQIVLKALFLNFNIRYLEGLRAARNIELGRMTADYVQERLDAEREIPESIWLAVDASFLTKKGINAWVSALQTTPSENKHQLALMGCQWQSDLPLQLKRVIQSLNKA